LNDKIHNLIPFRDALKLFTEDSLKGRGIPLELPSGKPSNLVSEFARPITEQVAQMRTEQAALQRNPELLRRINLIRRFQGPNPPPIPMLDSFDVIAKNEARQALSGTAAIQSYQDLIEQEKAARVTDLSKKYRLPLETFSSLTFDETGAVHIPDPQDQEDIKYALKLMADAREIPMSYYTRQVTQFSDPSKPDILLPPPPIPMTEPEAKVRLKPGTISKPAQYAY
jgi:hypothetical protein